jgi:hypothetical protein
MCEPCDGCNAIDGSEERLGWPPPKAYNYKCNLSTRMGQMLVADDRRDLGARDLPRERGLPL